MNFWDNIKKPFTVLAPMEDVTDVVFRSVIAELCPPDVFFTEFVSSDGLSSAGRKVTLLKLKYTENQRPIVAQIWGVDPEKMKAAARDAERLKFDGVDINMGCPDNAVVKKGAGAALIKNHGLVKEIINSVKQGAPRLPVSVKTRIGYDSIVTDEWIPFLLEQNMSALTLHGRIAIEGSKYAADWNQIAKAVDYKNKISPSTVIIGNGDIKNYGDTLNAYRKFGVDGVMIGRGIFTNPWVFEKNVERKIRSQKDYLELLLKHVKLFDEVWGKRKNFEIMKKFFKMYVREFEGSADLREKLMKCKNLHEVERVVLSVKL